MSEPEQIELHKEASGNEEDIHIPTTDLLDQEEQQLAALAGCIPTEEIAQIPIIPCPPSQKDILPTFTTVMATTTQTYAPTITCTIGGGIPLGPLSGSGSGGGGGGGGGGPGGGLARYGKLSGNPPQIFNGNHTTSVRFLMEWELCYKINRHIDVMNQPYTRCMLFLTYIQGDKVQNWVLKQILWLRNEINARGVQPTNKWLWRETLQTFRHALLNTMTKVRAQSELGKLKMSGGDIDGFIAKFKHLACDANYTLDEPTVLNKFIKGLPTKLAEGCLNQDNPETWQEWADSTRKHQGVYLKWQQILGQTTQPGQGQNQGQKSQKGDNFNQWCQGFRSRKTRDSGAMDTTPGQARAQGLSTDEQQCLQDEKKCFTCKKEGHFSRDCPWRNQRDNYQRDNSQRNVKARKGKTKEEPEGGSSDDEVFKDSVICNDKLSGDKIIKIVTGADDEVKDYIIQNVFMKEKDF